MADYQTPYGPNLIDWALEAAERENANEVASFRLVPRVPGDVELCRASKALQKLLLCQTAIMQESDRLEDAVIAADSIKQREAFDKEREYFAVPIVHAFMVLAYAQMRRDVLAAGKSLASFISIGVAEDMTIVGYPNEHIKASQIEAYAKKHGFPPANIYIS